ncbi:MAG: carboxylating nicotinate-nucleotide diphosphorylase [Gammaproteobacteria bacterium]|nr:MAG: carboxylating nicotinate-nucleotide diphosphorylase [Gammaproteobacteria bacterium]
MDKLPDNIAQQVQQALQEDIGSGDLTAALLTEQVICMAKIISRQHAVLCGTPWVNEVYHQVDQQCEVHWRKKEGELIYDGDIICHIKGPAHILLTGERTALNFLQTMSGIATKAKRYANATEGTSAKVLDTRKTIPGWRQAEKYAVRCGGCYNHRMGLFDAVLIKENHIRALGSVKAAVEKALALSKDETPIEIEVESLAELEEALDAGAKRILLDNFNYSDVVRAVALNNKKAELEVSGNITLDNISAMAETGIDYISIGDLTKNISAVELSMQLSDL